MGGTHIVIDTGPDFRQQMLREQVTDVTAVLFTHEHKDHIAGLDDIRAFNFLHHRDMPVYATQRVIDRLKIEYSYIFDDSGYPGVPRLQVHPIDQAKFQVADNWIQPIPAMHRDMPVRGFRFGTLSYLTDANYIPESSFALLQGTQVLVLNALRQEPHYSHFSLDEAIQIAAQIGAEQTYFTHISHQMGLHERVNQYLPPGVALAYDGLAVELDSVAC